MKKSPKNTKISNSAKFPKISAGNLEKPIFGYEQMSARTRR